MTSNRYTLSWNIWHHATLRSMAADGKSAREIGLVIGKTRNACIGMARRKGIQLTAKPSHTRVHHAKPKAHSTEIAELPPALPKPALVRFPMTELPNPQVYVEIAVAPRIHPKASNVATLLDRRSDQCGWIVGEITSNSQICAQPVVEGSSWCERHFLACHNQTKAA